MSSGRREITRKTIKKKKDLLKKATSKFTGVKKNCIMASMAVGSDDEQSYDDE